MTKTNLELKIETAVKDLADAVIEAVKGASLKELMELQSVPAAAPVRPPTQHASEPQPKPVPKAPVEQAKRISSRDKAALFDSIVEYLGAHPGTGCGDLSAAMGVSSKKMGLYLKELKAVSRVTSEGNRAAMRYWVYTPEAEEAPEAEAAPAPAPAPDAAPAIQEQPAVQEQPAAQPEVNDPFANPQE